MTDKRKLSRSDLWWLVLLTLTWGVNWPVMKLGVADYPPLSFRTLSMAGGLVVLGLAARARGLSLRVPRADWAELLQLAMFNMVIWYVLAIYGVKLLSSGRAAILGYTLPIWTALWGLVLYREHPTRRLWAGVAAAGAGVLLLLSSEFGRLAGRPLGTLCMLAAAIVWAYGTHAMRRRRQQTPVEVLTFWCLAISLVCCAAISWLLERGQWQRWPNTVEWSAIVFNAVVIIGFAQVLWFRLVGMLTPVASTLSVMLIPVIGLFSGMILLGERPVWQDWVALASILLAIASVLKPAQPPAARQPAVAGQRPDAG